ncbi:MAG TPA: SIR2 family protein [Cyclobacteriaceae bacterium]|nr:SIR2 family protein [Cyclobacteriaceae bacterium]
MVGRKVVWFFGAGASRGAGAYTTAQKKGKIYIPTQADFWSTVLKYSSVADRHVIESFLFHYFKMSGIPAKLNHPTRAKLLNNINVEEVFTFLSERMSTETISPSLRTYFGNTVWPTLLRSVTNTLSHFDANNETRKVYRNFNNLLLRARDSIVSFNYDIILEKSLPTSSNWYYVPLRQTGIPLFKPHGSINWRIKKNGQLRFLKNPTNAAVIIAPTHLKFVSINQAESQPKAGFFNQANEIPKIWSEMEKDMRQAKALVFIGYSFPDADLYFSSVMRSVFEAANKNILILIVNPDAVRISERLRQRFAVKGRVKSYFDFETFCKGTRTDILR